jgi:hypothetical protein
MKINILINTTRNTILFFESKIKITIKSILRRRGSSQNILIKKIILLWFGQKTNAVEKKIKQHDQVANSVPWRKSSLS